MKRIRFAAILGFAAAACAVAAAQPGGKGPILQFKQFGGTPEQFQQSALTRWTGQLALDLETVKAEVAGAKLPPAGRAAITAQADKAVRDTANLDQLIRRGAGKDQLQAAFAAVDQSLSQLSALINQAPAAKAATAATMARLDTGYHQLATALGAGGNDPARLQRRITRLGELLDDNAEELRTLSADQIGGNERVIDRAVATYAKEARAFSRRARDNPDAEALAKGYGAMVDRWGDVLAVLTKVPQLPAPVQAQAVRVDGLHRRLGSVLNLPAYPAGVTPPQFNQRRASFAVGADAGAQPRVTVFADDRGTVAFNFFAYDVKFDGGARVDMADLNGDGIPELVVAPGPSATFGGLPVRVFDGRDMSLLVEFVPFVNWKGGCYVAASDLSKGRRALIAVTAEGTQHVKVFDLAVGKEIDSFFAHDQKLPGGVRIAWGDFNGDGTPDLFAVNGPSTAVTTVKVFNGANRQVLAEFPVADNRYRGGAFIAAGDVTGAGLANPVVGLDAGAPPLVRVFDQKGKALVEWLAFDETFRGGVRPAVTDRSRVAVAPGPGIPNSPVRIFHPGRLKNPPVELVPFAGFNGGLNVGGR